MPFISLFVANMAYTDCDCIDKLKDSRFEALEGSLFLWADGKKNLHAKLLAVFDNSKNQLYKSWHMNFHSLLVVHIFCPGCTTQQYFKMIPSRFHNTL